MKIIKIKYSIISFILGLIPFIIMISIINSNPKHKLIHTTTLVCFGLITATINMIYTYNSINKKISLYK